MAKGGDYIRFHSKLMMKNFLFFIFPRKIHGEAVHETMSPMSFVPRAKGWANQDVVYSGVDGIAPGLLRSWRS
jgi:hypothetical protein